MVKVSQGLAGVNFLRCISIEDIPYSCGMLEILEFPTSSNRVINLLGFFILGRVFVIMIHVIRQNDSFQYPDENAVDISVT